MTQAFALIAVALWLFSEAHVGRRYVFPQYERRAKRKGIAEDDERVPSIMLFALVLAIPTVAATNILWASIGGSGVADSPATFYKPAYFVLLALVGLAITWSVPVLIRWWHKPLAGRADATAEASASRSSAPIVPAINLVASLLTILGFVLTYIL